MDTKAKPCTSSFVSLVTFVVYGASNMRFLHRLSVLSFQFDLLPSGLSRYSSNQLADRLAGHRIAQLGRNFGERFQHEPPIPEPRMWYLQTWYIDDGISKQHQIEIERPRSVDIRAPAIARALDFQQRVQQVARRQRRYAHSRGVQEHRLLVRDADRCRIVIAG
jgi:hypothetical protein